MSLRTRTGVALCAMIVAGAGCGGGSGEIDSNLAEALGWEPSVLEVIGSFAEGPVARLVRFDDMGSPVDADGVTVSVSESRRAEVAEAINKRLGPEGYRAYANEHNYGMSPDAVAVIRTDDPWAFVELVNTSGINYDVSHEAILAKLKAWDQQYGVEILGASYDWVEIRLETVPANREAFAREVYQFCPDIVDQGVGSVSALAAEIRKGTLFLWWD